MSLKNVINLFSKFKDKKPLNQFPSQLEKLTFAPAHGYMKGYIDMVFLAENKFYLIDWKSNFLGYDIENYHTDNLVNVMHQSFYTIQYHIYTLALHQYLASRFSEYNYENQFGGIIYIFLRGVDKNLGPSYGMFRDCPEPELLNEMGKMLIPEFK
jgi:exodeoxyribonuclease V beta subunit